MDNSQEDSGFVPRLLYRLRLEILRPSFKIEQPASKGLHGKQIPAKDAGQGHLTRNSSKRPVKLALIQKHSDARPQQRLDLRLARGERALSGSQSLSSWKSPENYFSYSGLSGLFSRFGLWVQNLLGASHNLILSIPWLNSNETCQSFFTA